LTIVEAKLTRDTELFGKMDPYCILKVREQIFKTFIKESAGKAPVWNETFDIDVKYIGDDFHLTVLDKDVTCSDTVGSVQSKLSALCGPDGLDDWFEIQNKGKSAGHVHLISKWFPIDMPSDYPPMDMGQ